MSHRKVVHQFISSVRLVAGVLWITLATNINAECRPQSQSLFLHYDFTQTVCSEKETRSIQTAFLLNENGLFQYSHDDYALGSLNESTEDRAESYNVFTRDSNIFSQPSLAKLATGLKRVLNLKSGPEPTASQTYPPAFLLILNFRHDCKENRVAYWTEQDAMAVKPAVAVVKQFLNETLANVTVKKSRLVTQGDGVTPIQISIPELLHQPNMYNGKRVKVRGYYVLKLEHSNLADAKDTSANLWIDTTPSAYGESISFDQHNGHEISVEGIFIAGPSGHFGMWKGGIKRVTQIQQINSASN